MNSEHVTLKREEKCNRSQSVLHFFKSIDLMTSLSAKRMCFFKLRLTLLYLSHTVCVCVCVWRGSAWKTFFTDSYTNCWGLMKNICFPLQTLSVPVTVTLFWPLFLHKVIILIFDCISGCTLNLDKNLTFSSFSVAPTLVLTDECMWSYSEHM